MQIAMKNPDRYAAVASFSGGLDVAHMSVGKESDAVTSMEMKAVFGTENPKDLEGTEFDLYHVVDSAVKSGKQLPKMYVSCGKADSLYGVHKDFCKFLKAEKVDFTEFEQEGMAHEWDFWDSEGKKLIDWLPVRKELRRA